MPDYPRKRSCRTGNPRRLEWPASRRSGLFLADDSSLADPLTQQFLATRAAGWAGELGSPSQDPTQINTTPRPSPASDSAAPRYCLESAAPRTRLRARKPADREQWRA